MKIISRIRKWLYMPFCRTYAKYCVGNGPADSVLTGLNVVHFWMVHGYFPNFRKPRSFEEKINVRMLFDRNPLWTILSDKLQVRDYVASRVGNKYLVPLLWHGNNVNQIPFDLFPSSFVIKTNHGCRYNIIVKDKSLLDINKTKRTLQKWLNENFCQDQFLGTAWGYRNIKPTILVESFLSDDGKVPVDYKFLCFSGRAEYLQMNFDRFENQFEKFFDREFNPLDIWQGTPQYPNPVTRPDNYEEMIGLADTLSQDLDFIRVDLYSVGGRTYVGELSCYPSAGCDPFEPLSWDFTWGEKWRLDPCVTTQPKYNDKR